MRTEGALGVVEAGYRLEGDDSNWMKGIAEASRALDRERLGLLVAQFHADGLGSRRVGYQTTNESGEAFARMDAEALRLTPQVHRNTTCETSTEAAPGLGLPLEALELTWGPLLHPLGVRDSFNVQGTDGSGNAICIMVALSAQTRLPARTRDVWLRVAVHLGAALRLRRTLTGSVLDGRHPILSADGHRAVHEGEADADGLDQLRQAARAVDRARSRRVRDDAERALELWQGLVAGRWSLVDVVDTDGRRFLVARENAPALASDLRLTRRERQIVTLTVTGQSPRLVAYAMGLRESTVRTHLGRALKKMQIATRAELQRVAAQLAPLVRPGPSPAHP